MPIYRRVLKYYRRFLPQTLAGLVLSFAGIGLNLLKPWPFKYIVDDLIPLQTKGNFLPNSFQETMATRPFLALGILCGALVVIQLLWGIVNWITNYIFVKIGLEALLEIRTDIYAHLQRLSLKYHDARRSSDSTFRVAYDSQPEGRYCRLRAWP